MALRCGIVGLPNVGKSTLFNALSNAGAESANYPFCTIEPNVGMVAVPDARLDKLAALAQSAKIIPATIEFVDIAGLVAGASKGEGLGNQFLSHIREVDAIIHVVRCFDDENIVHVSGSVNPTRDIQIIETELILKDLDSVDKRIQRTQKGARAGDKVAKTELALLERLKTHLDEGLSARALPIQDKDEEELLASFFLLSNKPMLFAANVAEAEINTGNSWVEEVRTIAQNQQAEVVIVSADIEAQLAELDEEEKQLFLADLGQTESGLNRLIQSAYKLLGLITYFTIGPKEARAWTITQGTLAPQAAGVIHSDFERGFIRAETIKFADYEEKKTEAAVRQAGLLRSEGKQYMVEDGDVMHFLFNV